MMDQLPLVSIGNLNITLYALLAFIAYVLLFLAAVLTARQGKGFRSAILWHGLMAGVLGLLLGRGVYCAVRADTVFYGSMGEFLGIAPFFDPAFGSVSIVGVWMGFCLAAPLSGRLTGQRPAAILDHAIIPGWMYFIFLRLIEPLSGQGYGTFLENPALCFAPLARANEWGDWFVAVDHIEAILGFIALIALWMLKKKAQKPGTLSLYAATILAATQIIPESLRCDDVLYIFIFARVTHIGLAVMIFLALLLPLLKGLKGGLRIRAFWTELALMIVGIGLCIATIFALDKTNLPKLLVYAVMFFTLAGLAVLNFRRIHKEDCR